MEMTNDQKLQVMAWAVDLAKIEFCARHDLKEDGHATVDAIFSKLRRTGDDEGNKQIIKENVVSIAKSFYQQLLNELQQ